MCRCVQFGDTVLVLMHLKGGHLMGHCALIHDKSKRAFIVIHRDKCKVPIAQINATPPRMGSKSMARLFSSAGNYLIGLFAGITERAEQFSFDQLNS